MAAKALQYAEETLGVHQIYEETQTRLELLDETLAELDKAQDRKRDLNERYIDREVELIDEMRSVHVSYSDTRFNSEMKLWKRKDAFLMSIQVDVNKVLSEIQGLDYDIEMMKLRIRAGCSRMEELGGYLHYLAAVKESDNYRALGSAILDGVQTQADNSSNPDKKETSTT